MIKCVIVDDERPARELIQLQLAGLPDFELVAQFDNALDAFNYLQRSPVDLVFLDIQMPKVSGIQLIKSLKNCPRIILTTAFREHAAEAFELDVLDYIVKPVTQDRFLKAISKFSYINRQAVNKPDRVADFDTAYIFLKVGRDQVRVFIKDILFIEGYKDYIKVHTRLQVYIALERLGYMEEKLPESRFARIHKSFIVALDKVTRYNIEEVHIADRPITIGRVYRNDFLNKISKIV